MRMDPANTLYAVGIDVGGTKIAAGLMAFPEGRTLARRLRPTEASRGGRAVLDDTLRVARELAAESAALGRKIDSIGLGVCVSEASPHACTAATSKPVAIPTDSVA